MSAQRWLEGAAVDDEVFALRPDYAALLVTAEGLHGGPSDEVSEQLLAAAEATARAALTGRSAEELPHPGQWREAYRAFGAKPQRTRPSVEALLRRVEVGLPRIDRITDVYNAVSIAHQLPIGGEDLDAYTGPPRLVRAAGEEDFDVVAAGALAVEHPEVGEVVWRDDVEVLLAGGGTGGKASGPGSPPTPPVRCSSWTDWGPWASPACSTPPTPSSRVCVRCTRMSPPGSGCCLARPRPDRTAPDVHSPRSPPCSQD